MRGVAPFRTRMFCAAFAAFAFQIILPATASATWSVIAADRSTGRIVIASATCVDRDDQFLMGVQAVVVPGLGVAACQAGVDNTHQNQMLVFRELQKGTEPKAIVEMLSAESTVAISVREAGRHKLPAALASLSHLGCGISGVSLSGQEGLVWISLPGIESQPARCAWKSW